MTFTRHSALDRSTTQENPIAALPVELGDCPKLVNLNLARTRDLKSPPPDIVERGTAIILTYLRRVGEAIKGGVLDLSCLELHLFPLEVTKIPTITKLNLFQNHLMELPEDLKYLTRLKELNAVRNELRYACQNSPIKSSVTPKATC